MNSIYKVEQKLQHTVDHTTLNQYITLGNTIFIKLGLTLDFD